jgi:hyperosmotically inducible protein
MALAGLFGVAQIAGCASQPHQRASGQVLDDSVITAKVRKELFEQKGVSVMDVQVSTYRGEVQLSGFVPSEKEARLAEDAARRVDGVKTVKNDIRIAPRS